MARIKYKSGSNYSDLLESLKKIEPLTSWDDLKENEYYHIPPILSYDRRDFKITNKNSYMISGLLKEGNKVRQGSFFRQEVSTRFLVKTTLLNERQKISF